MYLKQISLVTTIEFLGGLFTLVYLILVCSFIRGWLRLKPPRSAARSFTTQVSVIIAARNEEPMIARCLQAVFAQDYPAALFEVIVVDDHSTDRTCEVVRSFDRPGLRLLQMNEEKPLNSYKKKAVAWAIRQAKGELIITTDADCWMGPRWLSTVVGEYEQHGYELLSSPVAYQEDRTFFERLQTLEFMYLIGLGASAIGNAFASTCNGANLAYTKKVFQQVDGFKGIDDLASGDDELFLHKVAALYYNKIGFVKSPEAIVYTHAKHRLKDFIQQRKRWASKSVKYRNKGIVAIGVSIFFFNVFLLLSLIALFFNPSWIPLFAGMFLSKVVIETIYLSFLTRFFGRPSLVAWMPVLSLIHIFYFVYIGLAGQRRTYEWKGRTVR